MERYYIDELMTISDVFILSFCHSGIWNSADLLMARAFPPNTFAWVLVPFGVSVPILIILGAYSTATFRGVASNPRDNCKMFLVEYENPYAMLLKCVRKTEELRQSYVPTGK